MSADKHRSLERRLALLRRAANTDYRFSQNALMLNHLGGMSMHNRDLQRLLREGLFRLARGGSHSLGPKHMSRFRRIFPKQHGLHGDTHRTFAVLTPAGREFLDRH